jgi:hypothetical protein
MISILPLYSPLCTCRETTYDSLLTIGTATVGFSLATDDATCVLATNDILAWSLSISDQY